MDEIRIWLNNGGRIFLGVGIGCIIDGICLWIQGDRYGY